MRISHLKARMHARRAALAVTVILTAFAVNQATKNLFESWPWWVCALAAYVASSRISTRDRLVEETVFNVIDSDGNLPVLADLKRTDVGVHRSTSGHGTIRRISSWSGRADSAALESALETAPAVVISGPRLAGASTALFEALLATTSPASKVARGFVS